MNKKVFISLIIILIGVISCIIYIFSTNNQNSDYVVYVGSETEEIPIYDTGNYTPNINDVANKNIEVVITNIDDVGLPEDNTIQEDFNIYVMYSNYFKESQSVEIEFVENDPQNELVYNFKFKDLPLYGKYTDQAYVSDFWTK